MIHTRTLGALATGLVLLAAAVQVRAKDEPVAGGRHHSAAMDHCAVACSDCQRACDSCAAHCEQMMADGQKAHHHAMTLRTCLDCAQICATASQIVSCGGPFSDLICLSCADACARCAKECNKMANDSQMKKCADECLKCEKACRDMLKHAEKT